MARLAGGSDRYVCVRTMSLNDAALYSRFRDLRPTVIITIDDVGFPGSGFAFGNKAVLAVLRLRFADTEDPRAVGAMRPTDADAVAETVSRWLGVRPDVLVCSPAGVSRAAGVAAGIALWLDGDDSSVMDNPYVCPNRLCYTRILDAAGVEYVREDVDERFDYKAAEFSAWREGIYDERVIKSFLPDGD